MISSDLDNNRIFYYFFLPYIAQQALPASVYSYLVRTDIKDCGLQCENYTYNGDRIPIYLKVRKDDHTFPLLVNKLMSSSNNIYYDHFQENINSEDCIIVFHFSDNKSYRAFMNSRFSKMYDKKYLTRSSFKSLYRNNAVKGLQYNKYYYAMTKDKEYYEYILDLAGINDYDSDAAKDCLNNEFDYKLQEEEMEIKSSTPQLSMS